MGPDYRHKCRPRPGRCDPPHHRLKATGKSESSMSILLYVVANLVAAVSNAALRGYC